MCATYTVMRLVTQQTLPMAKALEPNSDNRSSAFLSAASDASSLAPVYVNATPALGESKAQT